MPFGHSTRTDYIVSHQRIKEAEARKIFRQMISALDYCHAVCPGGGLSLYISAAPSFCPHFLEDLSSIVALSLPAFLL